MKSDVIHIGDRRGEPTVHSSVRIPASLRAYAKTRRISLSRTLSATLAAVRDEEMREGTEATPTKQKASIPTNPCDPNGRNGH